jgi:hypothetical protein
MKNPSEEMPGVERRMEASGLALFRLILTAFRPSAALHFGHPFGRPAAAFALSDAQAFHDGNRLGNLIPLRAKLGQHFGDVHLLRVLENMVSVSNSLVGNEIFSLSVAGFFDFFLRPRVDVQIASGGAGTRESEGGEKDAQSEDDEECGFSDSGTVAMPCGG